MKLTTVNDTNDTLKIWGGAEKNGATITRLGEESFSVTYSNSLVSLEGDFSKRAYIVENNIAKNIKKFFNQSVKFWDGGDDHNFVEEIWGI